MPLKKSTAVVDGLDTQTQTTGLKEGNSEIPPAVSIPPLWSRGDTPRVDERGRVRKPELTKARQKTHSVREESPEQLSVSPSGSSEADSTMELSLGSCREMGDQDTHDTTPRHLEKLRAEIPSTEQIHTVHSESLLEGPRVDVQCAIATNADEDQRTPDVGKGVVPEDEDDDNEDEVWSPTFISSPTEERQILGNNSLPVDPTRRTVHGNQRVSCTFEDTSSLEFGCDHEQGAEHVETRDVLEATITEESHTLTATEFLGASTNPSAPQQSHLFLCGGADEQDEMSGEREAKTPGGQLTKFTPRRARSVAESDAAKIALSNANATLARLSSSPSPSQPLSRSISPVQATQPRIILEASGESSRMPSPPKELEENSFSSASVCAAEALTFKVLATANTEIQRLQKESRQVNQVLERSKEEHALAKREIDRLRTTSALPSSKLFTGTSNQGALDDRRKMESKNRFLEEELEHANAELSRTKARLSSSDIELQVLRLQFEKMDQKTFSRPRDRDLYSSVGSRTGVLYSSTASGWPGGCEQQKEMEAQLDMADLERRALEKGVKSLHSHASSLKEENRALHQSLEEALSKLASLSSERGLRTVRHCPSCGTEVFFNDTPNMGAPTWGANSRAVTPAFSRPVSRAVTPERERASERERRLKESQDVSAQRRSTMNEKENQRGNDRVLFSNSEHARLRQWQLKDTNHATDLKESTTRSNLGREGCVISLAQGGVVGTEGNVMDGSVDSLHVLDTSCDFL